MRIFLIILSIVLYSHQSLASAEQFQSPLDINKQMLANNGGATSGGGHDIGAEASRAFRLIFKMISEDKGEVYSAEERKYLLNLEKLIKILVTDKELPASVGSTTQNSFAFSFNDGDNVMVLIQSERWKSAESPLKIEKTLHHELAVLAGLEKTGEYSRTDKFMEKRLAFWQKVQSQSFACTFSLFSKEQNGQLGKFIGASGVVKKMDTHSGFVTLAPIASRASDEYVPSVIARFVMSAEGYLRAVISEADVLEKNQDFRTFKNVRSLSKEKVYFTPYDLVDPLGSNLDTWESYYVQVSCSKI